MNSKLRAARKRLVRLLPWKLQDAAYFYSTFGRLPRIIKPLTLNDYIIRRKWTACHSDPEYPLLADKFAVRDYVRTTIGAEWLIPLLAAFDSAEQLRETLSNICTGVLKPNHGAGMVKIIDHPPKPAEQDQIIAEADSWLRTDYSHVSREAHYRKIKPKIVLEQRIGTTGQVLKDFKLHVFNDGSLEVPFVLQVIEGRFEEELNRTFYLNDLDMPFRGQYLLDSTERALMKTARELSARLLGDLPYARVDWFVDNGRLYFGEITLTPASGLGVGYGPELDTIMGGLWNKCASHSANGRR